MAFYSVSPKRSRSDLCTKIRQIQCLKVLRLEGNTLGVEAALHIGSALKKHPELERLILNDVFTGRLKTEIPQALDNLFAEIRNSKVKLRELNLSDNAFGPIGMSSLLSILKSSCCHELEILRLHNNGLGIQGARALAESLIFLSSRARTLKLKTFICGRNRLENEGATELAKALQLSSSLEEIQMPQNGIGAKGVLAMFEALRNHKQIKTISFNDNTITGEGTAPIAQILQEMTSLEYLNIGDCLLENQGALEIAQSISNLHCLRVLIMSSNEIDDDSAIQVLDSLRNNRSINLIVLEDNETSDKLTDHIDKEWSKTDVNILTSTQNEEYSSNESDSNSESTVKAPENIHPDVLKENDAVPSKVEIKHPIEIDKPHFHINNSNTSLPPQIRFRLPTPLDSHGQPSLPTQFAADSRSKLINHVFSDSKSKNSVFKIPEKVVQLSHSSKTTNENNVKQAKPTDLASLTSMLQIHYRLMCGRQSMLDPSNTPIFVTGILGMAALHGKPGIDKKHCCRFINYSLAQLGSVVQTNSEKMRLARIFINIIQQTKCKNVQKNQIKLLSDFIATHEFWNGNEQSYLRSSINKLNNQQ
ncbi:hypothetical protein GJ496_009008 [Pomphorhynchus laevis]|nr:hypothetical protein GJ496_009008 [Pomphorhynchus laevis]